MVFTPLLASATTGTIEARSVAVHITSIQKALHEPQNQYIAARCGAQRGRRLPCLPRPCLHAHGLPSCPLSPLASACASQLAGQRRAPTRSAFHSHPLLPLSASFPPAACTPPPPLSVPCPFIPQRAGRVPGAPRGGGRQRGRRALLRALRQTGGVHGVAGGLLVAWAAGTVWPAGTACRRLATVPAWGRMAGWRGKAPARLPRPAHPLPFG
jgi:hypothetical protein